jgi:hypothetical protein
MTSIKYFTDLNQKKPLEVKLQELIRHLSQREESLTTNSFSDMPPLYEYVYQTNTKLYFDIDGGPTWGDFTFFVMCCIKEALGIEDHDIGCILEAATYQKTSIHATLMFYGSRLTCKGAAIKLQEHINSIYPCPAKIDVSVYGTTQKFRMIYSSKRHQNRYFKPVFRTYGSREMILEDTILSVAPSNAYFFCGMPQSSHLAWFEKALENEQLRDLWRNNASTYVSWCLVGQSCYVEGVKHNQTDLALSLFIKFSQFSDNPDNEDLLTHQFNTKWTICTSDQFNVIRKWVREIGVIIPRTSKKDAKPIIIEFEDINQQLDIVPIPETSFECVTRQQYILRELICNCQDVRGYLKAWITKNGTLSVACILQDPELANYIGLLPKYFELYGMANDSDLPFPDITFNQTDLKFINWLTKSLDVNIGEYEVEFNAVVHHNIWRSFVGVISRLGHLPQLHALLSIEYLAHYGKEEIRDWKKYILLCYERCTDQLDWKMQIPYLHVWKQLKYHCNQLEFNENEILITFALVHGSLFKAEKIFHYICNIMEAQTAAKFLVNVYPFWKLSPGSDKLYVFDFTSGVWSGFAPHIKTVITQFSSLFCSTEVGNSCLTARKGGVSDVEAFLPLTLDLRKTAERISTKNTIGYLLFENGIYDGWKQTLYPHKTMNFCGFHRIHNPLMMFMGKIKMAYTPILQQDNNDFEDMKTVYFDGMHGDEIGTYWRRILGMALMGIPMKAFFEMIGDSNCGKSTELAMIREAFGSYAGEGQSGDFEIRKGDNRAEDRQVGFLLDTWHLRVLALSEKGSADGKTHSNRLKKSTSGHTDAQKSSKLYENPDQEGVIACFLPIFYLNNPLTFDKEDDSGIQKRRNKITCNKVYVDQVKDPTLQLKKRPEVEEWHLNPRRKMIYLHLLIDAFADAIRLGWHEKEIQTYKPEALSFVEEATPPSSNEIVEQFLQYALVTGNPEHLISKEDLNQILVTQMGLIFEKAVKLLRDYFRQVGFNMESIRKKSQGVRKPYFTGIRMRASTINNDLGALIDIDHWTILMNRHGGKIPNLVIEELELIERMCQPDYRTQGIFCAPDYEKVESYASPAQINYIESIFPNPNKRRRIDE